MKAKRAHPPGAQIPPKDRLILSQTMKFSLKRAKTPLKSNKKRRLGTILVSYSAFLFGGSEGSRTPVRKSVDTTFYVGSYSFVFLLRSAEEQALFRISL